jgi:hypothetical protein
MVPPPPQPLTDAEWQRLCQISQRRRNGMESPQADLDWLDTIGPRLRLWKWPPPIIPADQLHPQIMIPIMIPAMYLAAVNDMMNTGA